LKAFDLTFTVPVCPHAGGVGLCEMVMHLSMFYYCSITDSMENRFESLHT